MDVDLRHELRNANFKDNVEYFVYKNTCDACMRLLKGRRQQEYHFTTQKVVRHFNDIVQKTVSDSPERVSLHLLVAIQLKQEPEFMQEFHELSLALYEKMKDAGSDQVNRFLRPEEIMVVLNFKPDMISLVPNPSEEMQRMVLQCRNGKEYLKHISAPSTNVVNEALERKKIKFADIPYDKRTPDMEIDAFCNDEVNLDHVHKKAFIDRIETSGGCNVGYNNMPDFIRKIEENHNGLTMQELERLRMVFVVYYQDAILPGGDFAISHLHNPSPSKAVKQRALETNPYAIGAIPFQYDKIQMLALKTAFLPNKNYYYTWDLDATYKLIKKPSVIVQKMYNDLHNLRNDMWYIANIKVQPEWMQLWLLGEIKRDGYGIADRIARAEKMFINPTKPVLQKIAEMRQRERRGF